MKYLLLVVFALSLLSANLYAQIQGGTNEKLSKLYNAGKYESCLLKADNLTYKDEYSRDPEVYLYMAMCFYKLSQSDDPILQEDYKNGVKQAIKYTSKFAKKDKKGEMYANNIEFVNELKGVQYAKVKSYFDEGEFRKAASAAKQYNKLNRTKDFSVVLFIGMCEVMSNNISQGSRDMDQAKTELQTQMDSGNLHIDPKFKPLVTNVFLKYSEYQVNEGQLKQAAGILDFGQAMFPNNGFIKTQLNIINKELDKAKQVQDTAKTKN